MAPVLMFCVGATKAGTSWLHEQLAAHPDCHLRSIKELHFFDTMDEDRRTKEIAQVTRSRDDLIARRGKVSADRWGSFDTRIADRDDWIATLRDGGSDAYLDYLRDGQGKAKVIGDVTPAYALMPVERLAQMARLLPDTRFVYLLRDPVARLWSHVRMIAKRRAAPDPATPDRAARILKRTFRGDETEIAIRGDYAGALRRLDAAVDPKRLLVMFYEELFGGDGLTRLCAFLGIAPRKGDTGTRVHAGTPMKMTDEQRDMARTWLAPQYDCIRDRFGTLPDAWSANMVRV
ncbi:sulfotransferase [Maribius pontilimi]|uniref:Sulfotransferase n=1 Tax=Palleronia pontilimi TaxID=1964209 RepID=A0A934ID96_9RHOB|nr:sulfotransferase [Palleronia pontilimi]MBJ3763521.1 sulfotransferase [Palleronia pontilimi]